MLTAQAKASPRLRMNYDLRASTAAGSNCVAMSVEKGRWHRLECLESGAVILECKDGPVQRRGDLPRQGPPQPLLLQPLLLLDRYQDDLRHSAWKEDRICGGGDMRFEAFEI